MKEVTLKSGEKLLWVEYQKRFPLLALAYKASRKEKADFVRRLRGLLRP